MSELQGFDKYFKQKMEEYSPPVPEHIWANILAEKDKKRPVPFLFSVFNRKNMLLVAAMLLLVAGSIVIYIHTGNQPKDSAKTKKIIDDNNTTQNIPGTINKNTTKKEKEAAGNESVNLNTNDNVDAIPPDKSNAVAEETKDKNQLPGSRENHKAIVDVENFSNQYHAAKKLNKKARLKNLAKADIADEDAIKAIVTLIEKNHTTNADDLILFKMLYYPEKNKATYALKGKVSPNFLLPPCPEIEKNAAGNKDYIEAYIGPDFAYKSYNSSADSTSLVLLQKRKESITFRSAFSAGFRYTRVFSNGVSIRGGINFTQINEKFTYVQSNIVQVTYIIDPSTGDTTGSYISNGSRYKTTYNHYRTVDIPVVFGFETGNGKIHANLNAGIVFNVRSWQNGETIGLDSAAQPIIVNTSKGNTIYQYKANIGAGFITAASVYYKLNDRLHLLAEPYWRYNFSPMSKEGLSLQEKYSVLGLRLGLRMDLQY